MGKGWDLELRLRGKSASFMHSASCVWELVSTLEIGNSLPSWPAHTADVKSTEDNVYHQS